MDESFDIWSVVSYSWTEIGLEDGDYIIYAEKIIVNYKTWDEVNSIIIRDVCASFALDTFLIFPCMLWTIMPDWGYEDDELTARMKNWYEKPYWTHFLNPFRVFGFPLALLFSIGVRRKLKKEYQKILLKN